MTIARSLHPLKGEREFEWRGGNPTRVEALTDMVFAFALTLLVVSNTPPNSFSELMEQLWGFPGFAAAFGILLLLWHSHYIFFRRYALEDGMTTTLNAALLFLVLFFVYPLKYLATQLSTFLRSVIEGAPRAPMSVEEAQSALAMLSAGYAAVFLMMTALYMHAMSKRAQLELSPREQQLTRFGYAQKGVQAFVGVLALVGTLLIPLPWSPYAGFAYFLIGPLMFVAGITLAPDPKPAPKPSM
jgi:uncharacterized membrane protein